MQLIRDRRTGKIYVPVVVDDTALPAPRRRSAQSSSIMAALGCLVIVVLVVAGIVRFVTTPEAKAKPQAKPKASAVAGPVLVGQSVEQCKRNPRGNIKILCEALKYDRYGYQYGGGHYQGANNAASRFVREFKSGKYPDGSSVLDCSSLVGVAVYEAFGVDDLRVAQDYRRSPNWQPVSFGDAKPGDVMYHLGGGGEFDHIVIVYKNGGNGNLTVFEAAGSVDIPYARQIRISTDQRYSRFTGALRYIGPGSRG